MSPLQATLFIAIFSLLSKFLGAARQAVIAHTFGASQSVDIYVAAFRFPDLLFNLLILGTLSVAFIPVFVDHLRRDRGEALKIASTIFNFTLVAMTLVAVAGYFLSPWLVRILVPGFSQGEKLQTMILTRILMLSPLLFSLSSVLTSVLQSFKRFILAAVAPLFYNLSIIAGALFLYPRLGLAGLAWGVVLGAFLHFAIQFPATIKAGLRPFLHWQLFHPGVKKFFKLFVPRIFGIDMGQISLLVASVLASFQAVGSLAVFYYAYDLESVPLGVFALSFAIAAFPTMAESFGRDNLPGLRSFFARTAVQIMFLMVPVSVLFLMLRAQIVRLILGAGAHTKFNFADTRLTAQALGFFALSLFAQSLVPLLARAFYAMQNTVVPVVSGLVATVINVGLSVLFFKMGLGPSGLAIAFSVSIITHMLIMMLILHRRLEGLEDDFLILRIIKISIAAIAMGVTTFVTLYVVAPLVNMQTYAGVAIQAATALVVAVLTYLAMAWLVQLPEAHGLVGVLRTWFFKFARPVTTAFVDLFTDFK